MMNQWGFDGGYGPGIIGGILMMVFWVAIIVGIVLLVVWLVRQTTGGTAGHAVSPGGGQSPLDILNMRYARGEIDKAEFEEKKRALGG